MQIGSSSLSNTTGFKYSIKLNDKETLIVEEDPLSRSLSDTKKAENKREQEQKKSEEASKASNPQNLSQDEERLVNELSSRDSEVRTHEAAHQSAGGGLAGGASYTYQQGPDGKMYAIGGEVSISMASGSTPEETVQNARKVAAAALAAGSPSPQDFSVASSAKIMEMKASQDITKESQQKQLSLQSYQENSLISKPKDSSFDISA